MHHIEFRQIVRDAEIAYAISPVVRRHRLTEEETQKFLVELRIPRAANVARITRGLVVNCSQKASSAVAATAKEQAADIQKVSAQLEVGNPATRVVNNPKVKDNLSKAGWS